jgi:ATP-dependent helicase/nuclease subunit A
LFAEPEEEAQVAKFAVSESSFARHTPAPGALTPVEIGTAHHRFLQFFDFSKSAEPRMFLAEATRLEEARVLSAAERKALDIPALYAFWKSEVGQRIRAQAGNVHRELEFAARFSPEDLRAMGLYPNADAFDEEFVVVQGVVDLAVILPEEIWVVDFKTDRVNANELAEKTHNYQCQLRLYARALRQIYGRPVTRGWLHFLTPGQSVILKLD